jgi:hypothetical protein
MTKYECPPCQLKKSDVFIKHLANLAEPFLITTEQRAFSRKFVFNYERFMEIAPSKKENKRFIMIRCLKLDSKGYTIAWPYNATLSVNREDVMRVELKHLYGKTRTDYPFIYYFNDTDLEDNYHSLNFKFARNYKGLKNTNELSLLNQLMVNQDDKFHYVVSIELVEVVKSVADVIKTTKYETNLEKLREKFFSNEIEESFTISLLDCFTDKPIQYPARGVGCPHPAVFDLESYLKQNRIKKRYTCPICNNKIPDLYLDGFIDKTIKENQDRTEICVTRDMKIREKGFIQPKTEVKSKKREVIDLSMDDNSDNVTEDTDLSNQKAKPSKTRLNSIIQVTSQKVIEKPVLVFNTGSDIIANNYNVNEEFGKMLTGYGNNLFHFKEFQTLTREKLLNKN